MRAHEQLFELGDKVIVLTPDSGSKLYARWIDPVTIKERVHQDQNLCIVYMTDNTQRKFSCQ